MTDQPNPLERVAREELREQIARLVDAKPWEVFAYNKRCAADREGWNTMEGIRQALGFHQAADEAVAASLVIADAILSGPVRSLLSALSTAEEERDRTYQANLLIREQQKEDFVRAETAEARALSVEERVRVLEGALEEIDRLPGVHASVARAIARSALQPGNEDVFPELPSGLEWRPITGAPRDGTWFLAGCWPGRPVIRVVRFSYPDDRMPVSGHGELWPVEPTHWMQLPPPPTKSRSSETSTGPGGGGSSNRSTGLNDVPSTGGEPFICPRCGKDCRPNGDPHLGTCAGPPTPSAPPPHRMQG